MKWSKCKGTTGKVDPSPQFLAKEKFTFQRKISAGILEHNVPAPLVVNLDQTTLSFVSPGKYTFSFKDAKNIPMKGVDDKTFYHWWSLQLLLFPKLEHSCPFNRFTREKPSAPYQSLNFQARSHLVTQKITGQALKNRLRFLGNLCFHISR